VEMADSDKTLAFYDMALITVDAKGCNVILSVNVGAYHSGAPYGISQL